MVKVSKELKLFPVDRYKPVTISAIECNDWNEANSVLREEYKKVRHLLSDADKERYDIILK